MIKLHNTKTRRKEEFTPIDAKNVRMYVCGPTVYDRAHLGNARPVVVFDTLFRLLRHVYGEDHVTYVRNFTDVDDKINAKAAETGRDIRDITDETIQWYHEDMDALGALRPSHEPRATEYIGPMVAMIQTLVDKGNAYEAEGHVLFDVNSYDAYGALSGRKLEDMRAGERVEIADYKRDPMDFVLWKPSTGDQPGWESPWGYGRPGWHIECSAMSLDLLGESFDIHGGGLDLTFPHHENEIAQSACAVPHGEFARVWMHNEMLQVEGKKMSKSLGNFFTVQELLEQGVPGEVIRLVLLAGHYRQPVDWTTAKLAEMDAKHSRWHKTIQSHRLPPRSARKSKLIDSEFLEAISDDLNTWKAIVRLDKLEKLAGKGDKNAAITLDDSLDFFGFQEYVVFSDSEMALGARIETRNKSSELALIIDGLVAKRSDSRKLGQYEEADKVRDILISADVIVTDTPSGPEWDLGPKFDPTKLEALK